MTSLSSDTNGTTVGALGCSSKKKLENDGTDATRTEATGRASYYIRQVNGVKPADILFSVLSVCVSVRTQSSLPLGGYMHSLSAF